MEVATDYADYADEEDFLFVRYPSRHSRNEARRENWRGMFHRRESSAWLRCLTGDSVIAALPSG